MFSLDSFSLEGKRAIVTGGTRGLCREIAQAYHALGAQVVLWGRSGGAAEEMGAAGAPVWSVSCDLSQSGQIQRAMEESLEHLGGRLDILVNGAGLQHRAPALEFPEEQWRRIIEVNLTAMFLVSQQAGRLMCAQGSGRIINIASMCSFFGSVRIPAYSASKGGVAQLTKALSNEWAGHNIQVNAIAPGYMATEMNTALLDPANPRYKEITDRIPAHRWGGARGEDMKGPCLFLASHASDYLNGVVIPVDGGYASK